MAIDTLTKEAELVAAEAHRALMSKQPTRGGLTWSASINELAAALASAQSLIVGAVKDSENPFFKSSYPDLASVWDACRLPLTTNGIAVIQSPSADGARVSVDTLLTHTSGQWVHGSVSVTAKEDSPQAVGSAITYLRRYALQSFAGIAPIDDDGEGAHGRGNGTAVTSPVTPPAPPASAAPADQDPRVHGDGLPPGDRSPLRPDPPYGYVYIDDYKHAGGWHDVRVGRTKYSTKTAVGRIAGDAWGTGRPVKLDSKPKENSPGEHWLNGVTVWNPPAEEPPF